MKKKKVWTGIGLFIVVLIIIFSVKLQVGPVDNEVMSKMSADFLSNRFKMPFEVTKIKYRFNENRSFYEVTSNPIGKPAVKVQINAYPPPKDNKGKVLVGRWKIYGKDYANILWGQKINNTLRPTLDNIFVKDFLFFSNITPLPFDADGFVLAGPYDMDDSYVEKNYKDFNFDTLIFLFVEGNKVDSNKDSEKIYSLIKEMSSKSWQGKHRIEIRYFNQKFDATYFKTLNKEILQDYCLKNMENNIYTVSLNADDLKLIKSSADITKYYK